LSDLGDKLDEIEGLKDKHFTVFGVRMTLTTIGMAIAGIGTVLGAAYQGVLMYQKVEELASLDIGGYQAQMEQTSNKIETQERLLESIEQNLRDAKQLIYDIEKRINDKIVRFEDKMDKFEVKVDDTKTDLEDKLQKALDNPLSGN
jgi:septal ring factor EnvC (AmiA/AmiB activator)